MACKRSGVQVPYPPVVVRIESNINEHDDADLESRNRTLQIVVKAWPAPDNLDAGPSPSDAILDRRRCRPTTCVESLHFRRRRGEVEELVAARRRVAELVARPGTAKPRDSFLPASCASQLRQLAANTREPIVESPSPRRRSPARENRRFGHRSILGTQQSEMVVLGSLYSSRHR
jgi:hypothetical protein